MPINGEEFFVCHPSIKSKWNKRKNMFNNKCLALSLTSHSKINELENHPRTFAIIGSQANILVNRESLEQVPNNWQPPQRLAPCCNRTYTQKGPQMDAFNECSISVTHSTCKVVEDITRNEHFRKLRFSLRCQTGVNE